MEKELKNNRKIILDLCGGTGSWSYPYTKYPEKYDVRLITLPDNDVRVYTPPESVYGILAAPPCTEFSRAKYFHGKGKYKHNFLAGLEVVSACMRVILTANPKWWALENPSTGMLINWLKKPKYVFNAWQFGHNFQKGTALWGNFVNPEIEIKVKPDGIKKFSMLHSKDIYPEYYGKLTRTERRAITPPGFAQAFFKANQ
jgi:hypothetical protein